MMVVKTCTWMQRLKIEEYDGLCIHGKLLWSIEISNRIKVHSMAMNFTDGLGNSRSRDLCTGRRLTVVWSEKLKVDVDACMTMSLLTKCKEYLQQDERIWNNNTFSNIHRIIIHEMYSNTCLTQTWNSILMVSCSIDWSPFSMKTSKMSGTGVWVYFMSSYMVSYCTLESILYRSVERSGLWCLYVLNN